jgi:hypothetical protein
MKRNILEGKKRNKGSQDDSGHQQYPTEGIFVEI